MSNICFQAASSIRTPSNTKQCFCMQKFEKRTEWIQLKLQKEGEDDDCIKCAFCLKSKSRMYLCTGCRSVHYCCKSHQKKHWGKAHSVLCKTITQARQVRDNVFFQQIQCVLRTSHASTITNEGVFFALVQV